MTNSRVISKLMLVILSSQLIVVFNITYCMCRLNDLVSDLSEEEADDIEPDGSHGCTRDWYVNHMKLTVQWGPGICASGNIFCYTKPKQDFLIHGFWPQKEGNRYPAFCCRDKQFDASRDLNVELRSRLIHDWHSLTTMPNHVFWQHEWDKHGTCAIKVGIYNYEEYFDIALKEYNKLDLLKSMEMAGIKPSNDRSYFVDDIINALSYNHGKSISYNCKYMGNQPILTEVYFCYDTLLRPIDCDRPSSMCKNVKILE